MQVDLGPSYELLAKLNAEIKALEHETHEKIRRWGDTMTRDQIREEWRKFDLMIQPMLRERDAVGKVIADYFALQATPPTVILPL